MGQDLVTFLLQVDSGAFQIIDSKSVAFLRHFSAHVGKIEYQNRNLEEFPVILVADLVF